MTERSVSPALIPEEERWARYRTHLVEVGRDLDKAPVKATQRGWIYQLIFPNDLSYVGQTRCFKRRMRDHKRGRKGCDGHLIKRAIRKHGWANVVITVLERPSLAELNTAEVKWITELGTLKPAGYNSTPGGDAQPMDDPEIAAWQKKRIGKAMRTPEVRAKKAALWKDPEHRAMQRAARTGSKAWRQARKDCQNTPECNARRRATWARKRAVKVAVMGIAEGREFMRCAKRDAMANARAAALRIPACHGRDPVAEAEEFFDKEIAGFEAGLWHQLTQASC